MDVGGEGLTDAATSAKVNDKPVEAADAVRIQREGINAFETGKRKGKEENQSQEDKTGADEDDDDADGAVGCLAALFGEPHNNHGTSGKPYVYKWPEPDKKRSVNRTWDPCPPSSMVIKVPPSSVDLMAHMVWESCIVLTDCVANSHPLLGGRIVGTSALDSQPLKGGTRERVEAPIILELGSGTALPSIAAVYKGAAGVVATDYPEECILAVMRENVER